MENNPVVVIGGNHHNTLGVIRSLGEKGILSDVIIMTPEEKPYVSLSKYIKSYKIVQTEQQVLDELYAYKADRKPVVIACADALSSLLDCHYNDLSERFFLPGSKKQGDITRLMDKEVMTELARDIGFCIPLSSSVDTKDKNKKIDIPLPWIIKPLVSKNGQKADIERIYSEEEWANYCERHDSTVQVQQLIDKEFEYQLIGLSLNDGNEVIIPGVSYVIRPAATTNTGFLHYIPLDESHQQVLEKGKVFLKETGYSGLFSLEFLRGKDCKDYFMEINFRNDGNAICVTAAGFNLPYIWYLYQTGGDYRNEINKNKLKSVYVMPEFTDLVYVIRGQLNLFTWLKDIYRTGRFMEYDKKDKAPFFCLLLQFIQYGVKKFLHLS